MSLVPVGPRVLEISGSKVVGEPEVGEDGWRPWVSHGRMHFKDQETMRACLVEGDMGSSEHGLGSKVFLRQSRYRYSNWKISMSLHIRVPQLPLRPLQLPLHLLHTPPLPPPPPPRQQRQTKPHWSIIDILIIPLPNKRVAPAISRPLVDVLYHIHKTCLLKLGFVVRSEVDPAAPGKT